MRAVICMRIGMLALWCLMATACATTGPGVNRNIVFQETPHAVLPYNVDVVEETPPNVGTLEDRSGIMPTPRFGPLFGLLGVGADIALDSMQRPVDQITEKESRGRFTAGEAFGSAARAVSSVREDAPATIKVTLIRSQPMLQKNCYPGCPRLSFDLQFSATFAETGSTTTSYYSFIYPLSAWSFFGPDKEKDVLRELTEYAIAHWAQQLAAGKREGGPEGSFPPPKSDKETFEKVQCRYNIFVPSE